jgi:hypothetical protein
MSFEGQVKNFMLEISEILRKTDNEITYSYEELSEKIHMGGTSMEIITAINNLITEGKIEIGTKSMPGGRLIFSICTSRKH